MELLDWVGVRDLDGSDDSAYMAFLAHNTN